ncbi:MAG TPA: UDP-glucose 4-epimerase GalE [Nitrospirota bacterium]|nr:UDP-glucose 4-epimerase GalE [Nitrospirota bacterium]
MILITGGAGYVGSHANKFLHGRGYRTVVLDNLSTGHGEFVKWGEFVQGDLSDREQLILLFKRFPIKAVMHFGAFAYVGESVVDPLRYYANNVSNTVNLLQAMKESNVSFIVFSSSCSTYGIPQRIPIPEEHPQAPINPYGRTKLMVEQILKDVDTAHGIRHVNLRYFNAAGADPDGQVGERHDPETHLIPLVLNTASGRQDAVRIFGADYGTPDGTCVRDYIHVTDLAHAHQLALEHLLKSGTSDSFNLANGKGFSVKEVIDAAGKVTGKKIKTVVQDRRPGDPPVLIGSSEKAKKILSWEPEYKDLEAIIQTAWKWHSRT